MDLAVLASMNFVAIVFAYLVAAFATGERLPRPVAIGVSIIYSIFLVPHFSGCLGAIDRAFSAGAHLSTSFPGSWATAGPPLPMEVQFAFFGIPMLLGWIGSLYYMHFYLRSVEKQETQIDA